MSRTAVPPDALLIAEARERCATGDARRVRLAARLTLAEVASEVSVSPASVHGWELGRRRPRGEAAKQLARLLRSLDAQRGEGL